MSYIYALLTELIEAATRLAGRIPVSTRSMLIAGAVLALIVGLFGYRLIKVFMGIAGGLLGYFVGLELFSYLEITVPLMEKAPSWISYVFGAVLALVFMILGFSKSSYAMFAAFALIGYHFAAHYIPDRLLLAIGVAFVFALISALSIRFFFILFSSTAAGFAGVKFLGAIIQKARFLQLGNQRKALWLAIGISVIFFVFQYLTRNRKEKSLYY